MYDNSGIAEPNRSTSLTTTTTAVWHLYADFGPEGGGNTTLGIFGSAEKVLDFIESFKMGAEIVYFGHGVNNDSCYYMMEFTAEQAINSGFLDMYKIHYWDKGETVYVLILEEIPLNKQLIVVDPEEAEQ